ncbi:hypothetical protein AB0N95_13620 [Streptomyces microflavus]|uniref:hypothetical protein n=1 Tax=Streptomyces microflavus TaxID=1919 RepID=UPI0034286567
MREDSGPAVGAAVHDSGCDRVGVVLGHHGAHLRLAPLGGGRAGEADPADKRPLSRAELLSAQLAEVNARSRSPL